MTRAVLILVAAAGCQGRASDPSRFVPSSVTARSAVTAALDAWKDGKPTGALGGTSPAVHVVDETRLPGQRLVRFDVLSEVPGGGPRTFTVALELSDPPAKQAVRYVVVGLDPLWVFRQEDFDKMAHWEMNMNHDGDEKSGDAK
jgi:hypothetical protein